ncbi:uncharacterized protein LOC120184890 [Hibiscus syriacus]|uniref:uncharacterized protein LOC120184890 n=1 Tax=Hibiscus syriacus TaxID=106335 RepID=UPI0019222E01|nr:uncharacterized protein LOC120184890 [Hibiscus syriacus]
MGSDQHCQRIAALCPSNPALGDDNLEWRWEINHILTVKSAYNVLSNRDVSNDLRRWKRDSVDIFQSRIGVTFVIRMWRIYIMLSVDAQFQGGAPYFRLCAGKFGSNGVAFYMIRIVEREDLIVQSFRLKQENISTFNAPANRRRQRVEIKWKGPEDDWVESNCDGAMGGANLMASARGVIRYSQGEWIIDFSRSLGICSALLVELWVVHDALNLTWNMGYGRVEVETDCKSAIDILNRRSNAMEGNAWTFEPRLGDENQLYSSRSKHSGGPSRKTFKRRSSWDNSLPGSP